MGIIRLNSRVGSDGVLSLYVPLGAADANTDVVVTIQSAVAEPRELSDWHEFVAQTYGSCADLGLDEPADLPLDEREQG